MSGTFVEGNDDDVHQFTDRVAQPLVDIIGIRDISTFDVETDVHGRYSATQFRFMIEQSDLTARRTRRMIHRDLRMNGTLKGIYPHEVKDTHAVFFQGDPRPKKEFLDSIIEKFTELKDREDILGFSYVGAAPPYQGSVQITDLQGLAQYRRTLT